MPDTEAGGVRERLVADLIEAAGPQPDMRSSIEARDHALMLEAAAALQSAEARAEKAEREKVTWVQAAKDAGAIADHLNKALSDLRREAGEVVRPLADSLFATEPGRRASAFLSKLADEGGQGGVHPGVPEPSAVRWSGAWQPIETAPKDGTPILAWCVHPHARWAGDEKDWCAPVVTQWTTFNGGGWTWNGMAGTFTHWMPLPKPPATPAVSDGSEATKASTSLSEPGISSPSTTTGRD